MGYDPCQCGGWPRPPDIRKTPGEVAKRPTPGIFARKLRENVHKSRLSGTSNAVRLMFRRPTDPQRFSWGEAHVGPLKFRGPPPPPPSPPSSPPPPPPAVLPASHPPSENGTAPSTPNAPGVKGGWGEGGRGLWGGRAFKFTGTTSKQRNGTTPSELNGPGRFPPGRVETCEWRGGRWRGGRWR